MNAGFASLEDLLTGPWRVQEGEAWHKCPRVIHVASGRTICLVSIDGKRADDSSVLAIARLIATLPDRLAAEKVSR